MTTLPPLSAKEFEQLSAYLDEQLPAAERAEVQRKLVELLDLRQALEELRQTRAMLRNAPRRRVPHNFTLKPQMVPARRRVFSRPVFSLGLASVLATFFLLLSVMLEFVPSFSFGASAPMAPQVMDAGAGQTQVYQAVQPTKAPEPTRAAAEMSKSANAATAAPTQAMKAVEATRQIAQPVAGLTPTPVGQPRTTNDGQLQATLPPPAPTKAPEATALPPVATQPPEPVVNLGAQPTETESPYRGEQPITRPEPRKTLTWLQTLLVVLALVTGLAALYLRRKG